MTDDKVTATEQRSFDRRLGPISRSGILPALASGCGGFIAIYILAQATASLNVALLIAPFGASCVLVFALPLYITIVVALIDRRLARQTIWLRPREED